MIIYVVGFLLILIFYFNKQNIKEGLDTDKKKNIYDENGNLVENCTDTNYKKTENGLDAYACPTGNCFNVYGNDLFINNEAKPTESKIIGQCCPYVYESSYKELNFANANTCDDCGYMYWDISGLDNNDVKINECINDSQGIDTSGSIMDLSNNIIKAFVDFFTPQNKIPNEKITTSTDLKSAINKGNKDTIQELKNKTVRQINQLKTKLKSSDPVSNFQHQIMGKYDIIQNINTDQMPLFSGNDTTIGNPWKYPLSSMIGGDIVQPDIKCINNIGVRTKDGKINVENTSIKILPGPPGVNAAWQLFKTNT